MTVLGKDGRERRHRARHTGGLHRQRRMQAVNPELRDNLPWRVALPSDDPDWWETHCLPDRSARRALPVMPPNSTNTPRERSKTVSLP